MMMKKGKTILLLILTMLLALSAPALAAEGGSLHVTYPAEGAQLALYRVAELSGILTEPFSGASVSFEELDTDAKRQAAADSLLAHAGAQGITGELISGDYKKSGLPYGIYLLAQQQGAPGYTAMAPTLVMIEGETEVNPKVVPVNPADQKVDIPVTKQWDDSENAAGRRPVSITVSLYSNGVREQTVTLTGESGWRYTFEGLAGGNVYEVREDPVDRYEVSYSGNAAEGFVIVNTYRPSGSSSGGGGSSGGSTGPGGSTSSPGTQGTSPEGPGAGLTPAEPGGSAPEEAAQTGDKIPQTGQLNWPVPVLAVLGVLFITAGAVSEYRERKKR